jgi:alginate O-acetyltransferase complex protein AlgI
MLFSSPVFLFLFLPLLLAAYFSAPRSLGNFVLLTASLLFYAWGEPRYFGVMLLVIATNYGFGLWVERTASLSVRKCVVTLAVAFNLSVLVYFKYAGFFIANVKAVTPTWTADLRVPSEIVMPLGISFYTFQAMSYVIDVYRGTTSARRNPLDLALYVVFFPQLIAGPIVRYVDVARELDSRTADLEKFASGTRRFVIGLGKKMLIANSCAAVADVLFAAPPDQLPATVAWLGLICYSLQIYFDFSGYSDMAIGLGRMFGFEFAENFNYPYMACSITDFWRRWHISLSSWFRDYVYIPLGGNRCGPWRTGFHLATVFLLCGLWHGAEWTFVVWGAAHGGLLIVERCGVQRILRRCPKLIAHAYVLVVVCLSWVPFRAADLPSAAGYMQALFGLNPASDGEYAAAHFLSRGLLLALGAGCLGAAPIAHLVETTIRQRLASMLSKKRAVFCEAGYGLAQTTLVMTILSASVAQMLASTYNPFIYFRF